MPNYRLPDRVHQDIYERARKLAQLRAVYACRRLKISRDELVAIVSSAEQQEHLTALAAKQPGAAMSPNCFTIRLRTRELAPYGLKRSAVVRFWLPSRLCMPVFVDDGMEALLLPGMVPDEALRRIVAGVEHAVLHHRARAMVRAVMQAAAEHLTSTGQIAAGWPFYGTLITDPYYIGKMRMSPKKLDRYAPSEAFAKGWAAERRAAETLLLGADLLPELDGLSLDDPMATLVAVSGYEMLPTDPPYTRAV